MVIAQSIQLFISWLYKKHPISLLFRKRSPLSLNRQVTSLGFVFVSTHEHLALCNLLVSYITCGTMHGPMWHYR